MSLADARAADIALARYRPAPLTKKERARRDREREARTFQRLRDTIEKCLTRSGCVTERDLQDFTPDELERHFTKARRAARVEVE
jgi:hypothetical protein